MIHAIDCLTKLMAHGFQQAAPTAGDIDLSMVDAVVDVLCECMQNKSKPVAKVVENEEVQLQVIRAIQVAVASGNSEVHDARLLLAVRSCYLIHLTSRNSVSQV